MAPHKRPACAARSYNMPLPTPEDYAKEPPAMPPHLQLTLLNVPPALDATASLPRPQVAPPGVPSAVAVSEVNYVASVLALTCL